MGNAGNLGRGLDALLVDPAATTGQQELAPNQIVANPGQPRRQFEPEALQTLADSITTHGVMQPLVVTPADENGHYHLIAGERRLRAAQLAGLATVPVSIRSVTAQQRYELAVIENLIREDLNPLEEAAAYRRLMDEFGFSQADVANQVGKARSSVANSLRLLELPPTLATPLREGQITAGHALALLAQPVAQRESLLQAIITHGLSVRAAEQWPSGGERRQLKAKLVPGWVQDVQRRLGTKVDQRGNDLRGSLTLHYHTAEQLAELLDRLKR